jgi:hypothetical protein
MFARFSVLLLAAVLASPALWQAFVVGDLDVETALLRYLIAVLIAAAMLGFLRMLFRSHHAHIERVRAEKRRAELAEKLEAERERRRQADGTTEAA